MPESQYTAATAPRGRWVIAHRGASGRCPENTLPSFRAGAEAGADAIELDVHLTADGHVVVMHDGELGRTVSGTGKVAEMTLAEVKSRDAGAWKAPAFAGTRVPTLAEVLAAIPIVVMVEIKPEGEEIVRRTVEVIRAAGAERRVVIASFHDANLARAARMLPEAERLALGTPEMSRVDDAHILAPHFSEATKTIAAEVHRRDRALWCWTVDDPADIARTIALGADGIISNWPDRVIVALGR